MNSIAKLTLKDRENLLSKTFFVLPDNPSDKNFSPSQIRKKGYEGYLVLFEFINSLIDSINTNIDLSNDEIEAINNAISTIQGYFSDGKALKAISDEDGRNIVQTYVTSQNFTNTIQEIASAVALNTAKVSANNSTISIYKNGVLIDEFSLNQDTDKTINIEVPTQAEDVDALPDTTKYGASISFTINPSTFVITAQLKDQNGDDLGSSQTIDLPLESVVVNGAYDGTNKKIVLTLQNGNSVEIPVGALVNGLVSQSDFETAISGLTARVSVLETEALTDSDIDDIMEDDENEGE